MWSPHVDRALADEDGEERADAEQLAYDGMAATSRWRPLASTR